MTLDLEHAHVGRHSVGVARQYCGQLGKQDNCQIAVSLSLANHATSLPVAWRLYLPLEWTADAKRRAAAGIPETVGFLTKPEIALEQIRVACAAGLPRGVVLMDAGYGTNTRLREEIGALGLSYIAGILPQTSVWPPGTAPLPPPPWSRRGRPVSRRLPGRAPAVPRSSYAATRSTLRSAPRHWRSICLRQAGRRSPG